MTNEQKEISFVVHYSDAKENFVNVWTWKGKARDAEHAKEKAYFNALQFGKLPSITDVHILH
jgi:hypothetical protein